jgi:hypothetical protein
MSMKTLLTATAVVELGAGLALLGVPSLTALLLLGATLEAPAAAILARIGGAAILALATVCWLTRCEPPGPALRGLIAAMLFYNVVVAGILAFAGIDQGLHGELLWPAAIFHVAMSCWCIKYLL